MLGWAAALFAPLLLLSLAGVPLAAGAALLLARIPLGLSLVARFGAFPVAAVEIVVRPIVAALFPTSLVGSVVMTCGPVIISACRQPLVGPWRSVVVGPLVAARATGPARLRPVVAARGPIVMALVAARATWLVGAILPPWPVVIAPCVVR